MMWLITMIMATFTNGSLPYKGQQLEGFSWRKISGAFGLYWAMILSIDNIDSSNALYIVGMWLLFVAVSMSLITVPQLLETITTIKSSKQ